MDQTVIESSWTAILRDGMYVLKHDIAIGKEVESIIDAGILSFRLRMGSGF
jgi:hypothetical protein